MNKSELKELIALKEAELKELRSQLKALQEAEKVTEVVTVDVSIEDLESCETREEATKMLSNLKLAELKLLAKSYSVRANSKQDYIKKLVNRSVGYKLEQQAMDSIKIQQPRGI